MGRHVQLCLCLKGEGSSEGGGGRVVLAVCVWWGVKGVFGGCRACNWCGTACGFAVCAAAQDLMWHGCLCGTVY